MSLESDIANMLAKADTLITYFGGKKADIDAAVARALAAIPASNKSFYINALTGVDTNDGTADKPLKTLERAIANTPFGGTLTAYLQSDYVAGANVTLDSRFLHLRSDVAGTKRKVTSNYFQNSDGTSTHMAGIVLFNGAQVMSSDVTFVFPSPAGQVIPPSGFTNSFFKTQSNGGNVSVGVKLSSCEILAASDWAGWVVGSPNSAVIFETLTTSFPASFGGRYVYGVAAGTNPATLANILTNLPTL
jgi:hypothetical protein